MRERKASQPTRSKAEKLSDYEFLTPLFLRGKRFSEMVTELQEVRDYHVSYNMVWGDMNQIFKVWKAERLKLFPNALEIQLKKLEKMETICWEQFEKSKTAKTRTVQKEKSNVLKKDKTKGKEIVIDITQRQQEKHVTESVGDGAWLDKIFRCWEMKADLMNLKDMGSSSGSDNEPQVAELIFVTRSRKNDPEYTEAIEVKDDNEDITQKLLQS
jgi:hypothetical protein